MEQAIIPIQHQEQNDQTIKREFGQFPEQKYQVVVSLKCQEKYSPKLVLFSSESMYSGAFAFKALIRSLLS